MGGEGWSMGTKLCDSCKTTSANLFCRADSAFLCISCDGKIHAANKLASRHARVWMCEVCERAPAAVTCKADAAALCVTCDRDIHSANPLARRHERFPVVAFYDSTAAAGSKHVAVNAGDAKTVDYFSDQEAEEEAEAASWLLPNPNPNFNNKMNLEENNDMKTVDYLFNDMDSDTYLDIDIMTTAEQKPVVELEENYSTGNADGVVPVQNSKTCYQTQQPALVDGYPAYDLDYSGSKPFMYNFNSQSISQSVSSSSSLEVGVVPDHNGMVVVSNTFGQNTNAETLPNPITGIDREARVLRYREKRKNRKFEKTIRYASRKAYAETRPRIKGRFAKRSEIDVAVDSAYGVVPSY